MRCVFALSWWLAQVAVTGILLAVPAEAGTPSCVPFSEANKYIGSYRCVSGKVLGVQAGKAGVHFVDFCEDHERCPFSVVVFADDLRHVGDIRDLTGKEIEIRGDIKEYDGHAEIILERVSQLHGEAARIPPLPKDYDVERRGHYSAGKFSRPKKPTATKQKKSTPPATVIWETATDESNPE